MSHRVHRAYLFRALDQMFYDVGRAAGERLSSNDIYMPLAGYRRGPDGKWVLP